MHITPTFGVQTQLPSLAALTHPRSPNAVDGLAHLGGFAMGLLLGSILYPAIHETRRHRLITWGCRIVAIPLIVLAFVLTIKNFCAFRIVTFTFPCSPDDSSSESWLRRSQADVRAFFRYR